MTLNDLLATPKEKDLLGKLIDISHLRPDNAVTPVVSEYYDLSGHYKVGDDIVLQYLRYKYTTKEPVKMFVKWFTSSEYFKKPISWHDRDIYQHQLGIPDVEQINVDFHHLAQTNKCKRFQHGCDK